MDDETRTTAGRKRMSAAAACTLLAGLSLAGCGQSEPPVSTTPTPAPTVSQADLAAGMDRIVFSTAAGDKPEHPDAGECLARAARSSGLSEEALAVVAGSDGSTDFAGLTGLLPEADRAAWLSPGLGTGIDSCVDEALGGALKDLGEADYTASEPIAALAAGTEDTTPSVKRTNDFDITAASAIAPGLVTMLSSYAPDDARRQAYEGSPECLSEAVMDLGLSQSSLKFLADGAPLGAGSIVSHLSTDEDKAAWRDPSFVSRMEDCLTRSDADRK